jgi:hypothetical protein
MRKIHEAPNRAVDLAVLKFMSLNCIASSVEASCTMKKLQKKASDEHVRSENVFEKAFNGQGTDDDIAVACIKEDRAVAIAANSQSYREGVKGQARAAHVAYCLARGREYREIEQTFHTCPDWPLIFSLLVRNNFNAVIGGTFVVNSTDETLAEISRSLVSGPENLSIKAEHVIQKQLPDLNWCAEEGWVDNHAKGIDDMSLSTETMKEAVLALVEGA